VFQFFLKLIRSPSCYYIIASLYFTIPDFIQRA